jgi:hypothetical protein
MSILNLHNSEVSQAGIKRDKQNKRLTYIAEERAEALDLGFKR